MRLRFILPSLVSTEESQKDQHVRMGRLMKIICWIHFLLALCVILFPHPCVASPPSAFPFISTSEEPGLTDEETEPSETFEVTETGFHFRPEMPRFSGLEQNPILVAASNVPTAPSESEERLESIADPLEPVNRAFFTFNDRLYFWVFKPVASGYKVVVPQMVRVSVSNFFSHVRTPVRLVNCLLQADVKCAGTETARFFLNTAIGFGGFFDSAKTGFNLERQDRDFGQTLGIWGVGPVCYFNWPILGPSSVRDTIGYIGDLALDPKTYIPSSYFYLNAGAWVLDKVNETSLAIGEYEDFKKAALDPYIALREAYYQHRQGKIRK